MTEAAKAVTISFSPFSRPKSRITRKARSERITLTGTFNGPSAIRDADTTNRSNKFHPSEMNGVNQLARALIESSKAKITVKALSTASSCCPVREKLPS